LVGCLAFGIRPAIAAPDARIAADLERSIAALSAPMSRLSGYPGAAQAADWLEEQLVQAGLDQIYRQTFRVPAPIDEGFLLTAGDSHIPLYGMWPNSARTTGLPSEGLHTTLVYGGHGRLEELSGQTILGRTVLLEYDSGRNWLQLFGLGAAAVVFLENSPTTDAPHRHEASLKFLQVPAHMPRLYARAAQRQDLLNLAKDGTPIHLSGSMHWRPVEATNILALIPGTDPKKSDELVLLAAHYDAVSPVPALAPGAEQAASAAALLHLARRWADQPPARSTAILLTAGHYQGLAGMRHFVPLLRQAADRDHGADSLTAADAALAQKLAAFKLRFVVGLDLSTGADRLGVVKPVAPYRTPLIAPPISERLMAHAAAYEDSALAGRLLIANGLKLDRRRAHLGTVPMTLPVEAAVAALAGCPALGINTLNDYRAGTDSPLDTAVVDLGALALQADFLDRVLHRLADDPQLEEWAWGNDAFGTLSGEVVHYGPRSFLPDQPTGGALVRLRRRDPDLAGVRPDFWTFADSAGRFQIPGISTRILYTKPVRLEAYGLDPRSGALTDAPDWGINGERRLPGRTLSILMDDWHEEVQIVTAPAVGLALPDIFDPRTLSTPERLEAVDATTQAEPVRFGACLPLTPAEVEVFGYKNRIDSWGEPAAVLFGPPAAALKTAMSTGRYGLGRRLLLLNAEADTPQGHGFLFNVEGTLPFIAWRAAADLATLNGQRLAHLQEHGVRNGRLDAFQTQALAWLHRAEQAQKSQDWPAFIDHARRSWSYGAAAYRDLDRTRNGVMQGALFLLAALLPFAHFAERLFCGFTDVRHQVAAFFLFFLAGFGALSQLHPAFSLSVSPLVVLLGFAILALSILVSAMGIGRLNRELRQLGAGHRRAQVHRPKAWGPSLALGLAHMRRRPLRTGLTLGTLVLLTFSVLSFTAVRASLHTNWNPIGTDAAYDGALVRLPAWKPLEHSALELFRLRFGAANVSPRAWLAAPSTNTRLRLEHTADKNTNSTTSTDLWGVVGLTANENNLTAIGQRLEAGRFLRHGETDACLLPPDAAAALGLNAADLGTARVRLFGESFTLVGLLQAAALDRPDLNGESLTPLDPEAQQPPAEAGTELGAGFTHLPGMVTAVFPFEAVIRWERAQLASIGLRLNDPQTQLAELTEVLDLDLFAGHQGQRYLVNTVGVESVTGLKDLAVPLAIAALIVLNTMLGAVYERLREIGTFNAVGLAPSHVSGLFLAEAAALGLLGALMGYMLGQAVAQTLVSYGWLGGLELNYSSMAAMLALGLVFALVLASALYPAHMAGRLCTPGIERRWRLPAPQGDTLSLVLPFVLQRRDALGMAAFLAEFWQDHREQSIGAGFYVEEVKTTRRDETLAIQARVWLAPFDQGISQEARLILAPDDLDKFFRIEAELTLLSGDRDTWRRVNRTFVDDVRKQFLLWRTLDDNDRRHYIGQLQDQQLQDQQLQDLEES
jgi:hypothetical protein